MSTSTSSSSAVGPEVRSAGALNVMVAGTCPVPVAGAGCLPLPSLEERKKGQAVGPLFCPLRSFYSDTQCPPRCPGFVASKARPLRRRGCSPGSHGHGGSGSKRGVGLRVCRASCWQRPGKNRCLMCSQHPPRHPKFANPNLESWAGGLPPALPSWVSGSREQRGAGAERTGTSDSGFRGGRTPPARSEPVACWPLEEGPWDRA